MVINELQLYYFGQVLRKSAYDQIIRVFLRHL